MKFRGIVLKIVKKSKILLFLIVLYLFAYYPLLPYKHAVRYDYIPNDEIMAHLMPFNGYDNGPLNEAKVEACPLLPNLDINMKSFVPVSDYNDTEYASKLNIKPGGFWLPDCNYVHNVAVIIPYRGRPKQLKIFIHYIHPFLQNQLINYRIFIVEQTFVKPFNRGKLMNIGFMEAIKNNQVHCVIFHDVDLIPLVDMNIYGCTKNPRHLSASINSWRFTLKYETVFGGVVAFLSEQFFKINGFSNLYFGWGGEDDDLYLRLVENEMEFCRFSPEISRYLMLFHKPEMKNIDNGEKLTSAKERSKKDGLNSLNYTVLIHKKLPLYTHIIVDL